MNYDRIVLPRSTGSAKAARQFLALTCAALAELAERPRLDDAQLLVSELVTNAVRYGAPPIEVRVRCAPEVGVHVSVSDRGPGQPRLRQAGVHDDGGRGLSLVML